MNEYFNIALKEADKALRSFDVPVGAVIVFNNKIISRAHNKRNRTHDVTNHAEIIAIKKAAKKMRDWRLSDCDLYVTLEPCDMCKEIILQSRIRNVYYLANKPSYKKGYKKTEFVNVGTDMSFQQQESSDKLSTFFKMNCKR